MYEFGVNTVAEELTSAEDYSCEIYKRCLDGIKRHSFTYVEYSHVHYLSLAEAEEIGRYAAELGLKSHSIHNEGSIHKYDDFGIRN